MTYEQKRIRKETAMAQLFAEVSIVIGSQSRLDIVIWLGRNPQSEFAKRQAKIWKEFDGGVSPEAGMRRLHRVSK